MNRAIFGRTEDLVGARSGPVRNLFPMSERKRMTRRMVLAALTLAAAMVVCAHAAGVTKYRVYVGTYTEHGSKGIYVCDFDAATGQLSVPRLAAESLQPSFLAIAPDNKFLYASNEVDAFNGKVAGAVSAFSIGAESGALNFLNQVSSRGPGPAFIVVDRSGRYVLVANYDGGSAAVFRLLADGKIGESTAFAQHRGSSVNHERQEGPHAHAVALSPDNRFAIVADLGIDELLVYPFDAARGTLGEARVVKAEPGVGPRHLAFGVNGQFVYVINELSSTITVYSYDAGDGAMTKVQDISALPGKFSGTSTAAEIVVHPSGNFLYASNRGDDSIASFAVDPAHGTLTPIQRIATRGKTPRSFAIDPSGQWLIAANQGSNSLVTFRIDKQSGRLTTIDESMEINSPAMVDFARDGGEK
jgi:6-phosphogluconolactonase